LKIDGTAGPLHAADVTLTPLRADVKLSRLDLSQSALVDPDLGIGGSADFEGAVRSDGLTAKARGTIRTKSLRLVAKGSPAAVPVEAVIAIEHDLQSQTGKILQADVTIGKALARLTGTYDMHGEATSIHTTLNGLAMPVDDLEAMLPAAGVTLPTGSRLKGGNISLQVDSTGPLNALVSTGWVRMSNSALAGFNLNSRISALSALTGRQTGSDTTIESLSSDLRHTSDGTRLDRINMLIPSLGTVTGSGTISSSDALDFKMVAKLSGTGVGFTKVAGLLSGGIPVSIGGTTSNPTFNPDMKALVNGTLKGLTDGKENPLSGLKAIFGKKNP
jgi:AsmA protein